MTIAAERAFRYIQADGHDRRWSTPRPCSTVQSHAEPNPPGILEPPTQTPLAIHHSSRPPKLTQAVYMIVEYSSTKRIDQHFYEHLRSMSL